MKTAFISGHLDLTLAELIEHYDEAIKQAILDGHNFVVGDAPGADWLAQCTLFTYLPPADYHRVTVYHMKEEARNCVVNFRRRGGFNSQNSKDAAMTKDSDYDLAWVRPGREGKSGTWRNLERRKGMLK